MKLTGPRYLMHCCWSFDLGPFARFTSFPSPISNLESQEQRFSFRSSRTEIVWLGRICRSCLPVKEGFSTLTLEPLFIIEVKIVAVPMPRVDLIQNESINNQLKQIKIKKIYISFCILITMNLQLRANAAMRVFEPYYSSIDLSPPVKHANIA